MSKLRIGQLLVQHGLVTEAQLEEALTAQQIYGGRLGTILVEHGFVHEDDLAQVLAGQSGMRRAGREDLADVPATIVAMVSRATAERYRVVPFAFDDDRNVVSLATVDPGNLQLADELQFALGRGVELLLCPEIVLERALQKYYGVKRHVRFIKLSTDAPQPRLTDPASTGVRKDAARHDGGILDRLVASSTTPELLCVVIDWLTSFGEQVVFFAARGEAVTGWSAQGLPGDQEALTRTAVRIADSPLLGRTLASRAPAVENVRSDAVLEAVLQDHLFVDCDESVLLLPLVVADRVFGIFLIGRLHPGRSADPTLLAELMRRVGWRIQAIHLMESVTAPLAGKL